jgi:hypothetical protein
MRAREFDKAFDEGKDISSHLDLSKAKRSAREQKRVNVDFPVWMIQLMDKEAKRLGVPRGNPLSRSGWRNGWRKRSDAP